MQMLSADRQLLMTALRGNALGSMRWLLYSGLGCLAIITVAAAAPADDALADLRQAIARGDQEQALKLATQRVTADAENAESYLIRATVYDLRNEVELAIQDYSQALALEPEMLVARERRGEDYFRAGQFAASVADFDRVLAKEPGRKPYHWQRGISLYYGGDFAAGAEQFELHRTVNPDDVENAVWHYLCVARQSGVEEARRRLIPIGHDGRVPLMQIYGLFAGTATSDDVLAAARAGKPSDSELSERLFYAHLYLGLFDVANGRTEAATEHILLAAGKYAQHGYMGDVARVQAAVFRKAAKK